MSTDASSTPAPRSERDEKRLGRLIAGAVFLCLSVAYTIGAWQMPRGTFASPGPGMFPVGVGVAATAVAIVVVLEGLTGRGASGDLDLPKGFERKQSLVFFGTLVGLVAILPVVGMTVGAILYVVATLKFLGGQSWTRSLIMGALIGGGVTLLFTNVLDVPLPAGIW